MLCENAAQSNDYFEFIGEYSGVLDYVKEEFNTECITVIDQRFAIAYVKKNGRTSIYGQNYPYNTIPRCFGLMDTQMLEDVGVAQVRRSVLDLYGNGVLVGMIDTGIDYEHPAFRYEDGSSKIYSLWDQTIEGDPEDTFLGYGTEYTKEQIEEALKSDVPQQKVPSKDESGHGTFLAGLIAGNEDNETGFSGIAPNAGLIVVKLRKAKDYLKEYYCIDPKYEAYAETDIMLAVHYIDHIAEQLQRPIVIFLGIGTNLASHLGTGPLDQYLSGRAMLRGVAVVTSAGNEGQARHHYSGQVSQNDEKVEAGIVLSQDPEDGENVNKGSKVKLVVSKGSAIVKVEVPSLVGKNEQEAKALLAEAGLKANIINDEDDSKNDGVVLRQSKEAGTQVQEGTTITITVNKVSQAKETTFTIDVKKITGGYDKDETGNNVGGNKSKTVDVIITVNGKEAYRQSNVDKNSTITAKVSGKGSQTVVVTLKDDKGENSRSTVFNFNTSSTYTFN